jgi:hypothetical protein
MEYRVTPAAESRLLEDVLFYTTRRGLSVPELLIIPASVAAVRQHTDFEAALIRQVFGA